MRSIFRRAPVALTLLFVACAGGLLILVLGGPTLRGYQQQIDDGTRAIAAATTDTTRAAGHIKRGRGYAEMVRYRSAMRSVGAADYVRLYQSAMHDLDAAVQLDPNNIETFNVRGLTYFEHSWTATANGFESRDAVKTLLALAKADFTAVIDRDARNETTLDYRGMTNENLGDYVAAIDDYTRVAAVNAKLGKIRLADVYCRRGGAWNSEKKYDKAVADFELSISLGENVDGCDCDPYPQLLWTYFEGLGDFDKSWTLVHRAQSNRRWLTPELVEKLKAASSQNR